MPPFGSFSWRLADLRSLECVLPVCFDQPHAPFRGYTMLATVSKVFKPAHTCRRFTTCVSSPKCADVNAQLQALKAKNELLADQIRAQTAPKDKLSTIISYVQILVGQQVTLHLCCYLDDKFNLMEKWYKPRV